MHRFALLAVLAILPALRAAGPSAAAPVKVGGFTYVRTLGAISEYTLDANGLSVLLMPAHAAPELTFMVTYRVGSRNEVTGTTGATHLLEHLMFKGTAKHNRTTGNGFDQVLAPLGAINNATTWLDRTNYYVNAASDQLPVVVELLADTMRNLLLLETDRQPEMTVVRNEFERGENDPERALDVEIGAAAYIAHPYHHSTIGWRSDIEQVSIAKLREFYDTFYWPDNATVSVIGDFQPAAALALIAKFYGPIPRAPKPIPQVYTEEPAQTFPRRVGVKRAGELGVVGLAYKICPATSPDFPALSVLGDILADGKNARLYRALTDRSLTTSVSANTGFNRDNSLLTFYASLAPGAKHDEVERRLLEEITRLKKDGVTATEVQTAVAKSLAATAFRRDGSFAIASSLNECIAATEWTLYYTLDEALKKVTPADVLRVAEKYLDYDQSTTGWFVPLAASPPAK